MSWVEHEGVIGLGPSFVGTEGTSTHVLEACSMDYPFFIAHCVQD